MSKIPPTQEQKNKIHDELAKITHCTRCNKKFEENEARFPWPMKELLCRDCLIPMSDAGLGRLNKVLRGEKLEESDFSQQVGTEGP